MGAVAPLATGTAVYRDIYGSARSVGATEYSFSSWRTPDQWWHRGGGFDFEHIFHGHGYARAGNCNCYTGDASNCHSGGGELTSGTNASDI